MATALLSIGSNKGNRIRNIRLAVRALRHLPRVRVLNASSVYESSPVGTGRQNDYLNCCVTLKTGLSPMGLLVESKRIEAALGRTPAPRWSPRSIDIDILFYLPLPPASSPKARGSDKRLLILPHPRALRRKFVLAPLAELRPRWIPPVRPRRTVLAWLRRLNGTSQNVNLYVSDGAL